MRYEDLAARFDLFLFDMDGTLILGDTPLPGAVTLLENLRAAGKEIHFVTNNTMHPKSEHAERLNHAGIPAGEEEILTPLAGLLAYVEAHGITNAHVIASEDVKQTLNLPADTPQAVILGLCRNWDYAQLQIACNLALQGKPFILCQPDPYCPDPDGNIPDSGALLALIETAICLKLDPVVIGKPSPELVRTIVKNPARTAFFGDRLKTDMALADASGMHGVLVLTGQTKRADVTGDMPYTVLDSLADLFS